MLLKDPDVICEMHNLDLLDDVVPVIYGLFRYSEDFRLACQTLFPKSKFFVLGGCVLQFGCEFYHPVRFCPKCRESHLLWAKENSSCEGLPPSAADHAKYIELSMERIGVPKNIPAEAMVCIEGGELSKAIKLLKAANPDRFFSEIKGYVNAVYQKSSK